MFGSIGAYAAVTADLDGGMPATVSPGTYRYTYTMTLQSDVIQSGDYFVVYDFYGYKPGTISGPVTWLADASATMGPTPNGVPTGDASVTDLVWTYQGAAISAAMNPIVLGKFGADSSVRYNGRLTFGGITNGGSDWYYGFADDGSTPEPSSALLVIGGLAGLAYLRSRKRASERP